MLKRFDGFPEREARIEALRVVCRIERAGGYFKATGTDKTLYRVCRDILLGNVAVAQN